MNSGVQKFLNLCPTDNVLFVNIYKRVVLVYGWYFTNLSKGLKHSFITNILGSHHVKIIPQLIEVASKGLREKRAVNKWTNRRYSPACFGMLEDITPCACRTVFGKFSKILPVHICVSMASVNSYQWEKDLWFCISLQPPKVEADPLTYMKVGLYMRFIIMRCSP